MVQRAYSVMSNDVLIAIPLFVFMGYLVERAELIDQLFKSLHLATARVPGALAVATIVTCAIFATATGIVGAVVTLMGLLAFPAMLKAGYNIKVAAGAITAGGCLGILIPPSVLLIVYGAVAGVSVVQLYAGAFFPGFMLAGLYIGYVIVLAKLQARPDAAAARERARRGAAVVCASSWRRTAATRWPGCGARSTGGGERRRREAHRARAAARHAAPGALHRRHAGRHLAVRDRAGGHGRHGGAGRGRRPERRPAQRGTGGRADAPDADKDAGGLQEPPPEAKPTEPRGRAAKAGAAPRSAGARRSREAGRRREGGRCTPSQERLADAHAGSGSCSPSASRCSSSSTGSGTGSGSKCSRCC